MLTGGVSFPQVAVYQKRSGRIPYLREGAVFFPDADFAVFVVAVLEEGVEGLLAEVVEVFFDGFFEFLGGGVGVAVGTAEGLADDGVCDAEVEELACAHFEGF